MKAPVKSITITRVEGPIHQTRRPVTVDSWRKANVQLQIWSGTAPEHGGYDKCDFVVEWENGAQYEGRYDLTHWRVENPRLADHILGSALFYTGRQRPSHMSEENYAHILSYPQSKSIAEQYQRLLDWCDLDNH